MKKLLLIIPFIFTANCATMFPCPRKDTMIMNKLGCPTLIEKGALGDKRYMISDEEMSEMLDRIEEEYRRRGGV